jgi:hypothetical protein
MRRFFYFGCHGNQSGHYLHDGNHRVSGNKDDTGIPYWLFDGTFAPLESTDRGWKLTQLRMHGHHVLSILACHDNTIDARPGSNAAFIVIDVQPWDEEHILAEMRVRYPDCWERLTVSRPQPNL